MATRISRQGREFITEAANYSNLFAALFQTSRRITNLPDDRDLRPSYIMGVLYERGAIAYHRPTGVFLPFTGNGEQNLYGYYDRYTLTGAGGTHIEADRDAVAILRANPAMFPLADFVRQKCAMISNFDVAARQNLDAVKRLTVIITENAVLTKKLQAADAARVRGEGLRVIEREALDVSKLDTLETGAEYIVTQILDDRRKVYEELLHVVGVETPIEKGERMITDEVQTQNAETNAYIQIMERTFNEDAEREKVPFRMERAETRYGVILDGDGEKPDNGEETPQNAPQDAEGGKI